MSEPSESAAVIDLAEARRDRLHDIHEARLIEVRSAFEKAFPLPAAPAVKKRRTKKKAKKR